MKRICLCYEKVERIWRGGVLEGHGGMGTEIWGLRVLPLP